MAKKKPGRGDFNMAEAIRNELRADPDVSLADCRAAVSAKYPSQTINPTSFGVAYSNQRKNLGLKPRRGRRKTVRRAKPAVGATGFKAATAVRVMSLEHLQAARRCVTEIGDADTAIAAIKQLANLQFG